MLLTQEYKQALLNLHTRSRWGITAGKYAGDSIFRLLEANPAIQTILDYGCGEGTLKNWIEDKGITDKDWTLYDPGMLRYQKIPTGKFDLVITTDVLEHVEEIALDSVLKHLRELTGKFLYNEIACYLANAIFEDGPYKGQPLHINLKAPDAWRLRLAHPSFDIVESYPSLIHGWKVRYLMIQKARETV